MLAMALAFGDDISRSNAKRFLSPLASLVLFCLTLLPARPAVAAWPSDPLRNSPVCTNIFDQQAPAIVADGAGGAIVAWEDNRNGYYDIYAKHVLASGYDAFWPIDGLAVCTAASTQYAAAIATDGAGGAIVVWYDERNYNSNSDIYAQHVLAGGTVDSAWPVDGRALCMAPNWQIDPLIVADGVGGAIVTWVDGRAGRWDIYAQHVMANGTVDPAWPVDGRAVGTAAAYNDNFRLIADGAGGVIVTWVDDRKGPYDLDIDAQHVLASGALDPAWPVDGCAVCSAAGVQDNPAINSDGAGGAIVTWNDLRSGAFDIYAQHVLTNGTVDLAWPINGRALCIAPSAQRLPTIVADGDGGAIVTWFDERTNNFLGKDIYAQHVQANGVPDPAWPVDGLVLCTAWYDQGPPVIITDGAGGAIVTWDDYRSGTNHDIYAQHVLANGKSDSLWPSNGRAISTNVHDQTFPVLAVDGVGGAVVTWRDSRGNSASCTACSDIYAQRVLASGELGGGGVASVSGETTLEFTLGPVQPNPTRGEAMTIRFTLSRAAPASLEMLDVTGRRIAAREVGSLGAGSHSVALETARDLKPGIYLVRLNQGASSRAARVTVLE